MNKPEGIFVKSVTLFSLLGLMFVDTSSSHRKWFVNNTLPVTSAKSVQTDGDLLHGWRVQLFWRLSSGRTKRFPAAGWILQPPRSRWLLFKHQVQGLFHPLRWSLQTIIKTQNGANPNTVLSCCTTIGFIGPSPNETDCSDVKRCFVLNSEVNTSWRTSSSNFRKKMAFATAMKKFWISQYGFLQVEVCWFRQK